MVDNSTRKFIKQTLKFSVATGTALATFPITNLYQERILPKINEQYPDLKDNLDLTFIDSLTPHLIIGSSVMSFIMMYADQLETFAILLIAALSFLFLGIPLSEYALNIFL